MYGLLKRNFLQLIIENEIVTFFFIFGLKFSQPERFLFPFFRVMTVEFVNNHANVAIGDPSRPGRGRGKGLVQHCCHSGLWRVY